MRHAPIWSAAVALALVAACATPPPVAGTPPASPPAPPSTPPANEDTCGAAAYSSYVGRDYRQVPPAPQGRTFRVVCTTCAMTKDYSAQRLNFFYDEASGKVVRLSCG